MRHFLLLTTVTLEVVVVVAVACATFSATAGESSRVAFTGRRRSHRPAWEDDEDGKDANDDDDNDRRVKRHRYRSEDYYGGDIDAVDEYGAPKDSSYHAPSSGYHHEDSYEPPSYHPDDDGDPFLNFINSLVAFLPVALFLAAIAPGVVTITVARRRRRRRRRRRDIPDEDELTILQRLSW